MYYVYVLCNPERRKYIGFTENLNRRIKEHNNLEGKKRGWTRTKGPWILVYNEEFETKKEALKREKELKSGIGRKYLEQYMPW